MSKFWKNISNPKRSPSDFEIIQNCVKKGF